MAVESHRCAAREESGMFRVSPERWLKISAPPPTLEAEPRRSDGSCVHDTKDGTTATRWRDPPIDPISDNVDRGLL